VGEARKFDYEEAFKIAENKDLLSGGLTATGFVWRRITGQVNVEDVDD